jgi:hypothetical protein
MNRQANRREPAWRHGAQPGGGGGAGVFWTGELWAFSRQGAYLP